MPFRFDWKRFNSKTAVDNIGMTDMLSVMAILSDTAQVHRNRDLFGKDPNRLMKIVNEYAPNPHTRIPVNYMQIDYGVNHDTRNDVAIIYRYFAKNAFWSVTVGFHKGLLPDIPVKPAPPAPPPPHADPTKPIPEYLELAILFAQQIRDFFKNSLKDPGVTCFKMIDDAPNASDEPCYSKIGYLIEVAKNNPSADAALNASWSVPQAVPIPLDLGKRPPIPFPGYGPPGATNMYVTTVTPNGGW